MFNPHAPSNRHTQLSSCYRKHEQMKKRAYEQRIREVEHASFTPLVISATGGLANEASTFYKRLASLLASKWDHPTAAHYAGCAVVWLSPSYVLLSRSSIIVRACHQDPHRGRRRQRRIEHFICCLTHEHKLYSFILFCPSRLPYLYLFLLYSCLYSDIILYILHIRGKKK